MAERFSISRQRPVYVERATHDFQKSTVVSRRRSISARRILRAGPAEPVSSTMPRTCPARRLTVARTSPSASIPALASRSSSGSLTMWTVAASSPARNTAPHSLTSTSCRARP